MIKHDEGKQRWDFVPMDALNEVVKVYTWGHEVKGYGPENWKTVEPRDRYYAALLRHLAAWRGGEKRDHESSLFAMAHVIFNALCLLWFDMQKVTKSVTKCGDCAVAPERCVDYYGAVCPLEADYD